MLYPEGTKVLVKPDTPEEITKGGLIVPEMVRDKQQHAITRGEIVALGPHAEVYFGEDIEGVVKRKAKPGDKCMFVQYAGSSFKWGEKREEYRFLQDQDIVCYIDDSETDPEMPDTRKPMVK